LTSGSEDELIIMNKLFTPFQYDLLPNDVDGSDGLIVHALLRCDVTRGVKIHVR